MKCSRCGRVSRGASWYCASCGAPLPELNVADSLAPPRLPPLLRWSLAFSLAGLLLVLLATVVVIFGRSLSTGDRQASPLWQTFSATTAGTRTPLAATGTSTSARGDDEAVPAAGRARPAARGFEAAAADGEDVSPKGPTGVPLPTRQTKGGARGNPTLSAGGGAGTREAPLAGTAESGSSVGDKRVPSWPIAWTAVPPELDAWLDDWRSEPMDIVYPAFGTEYWQGPADLSGRAFAAWDETALYLGVRVTDDFFSQPARGAELHLGDSLELQLDTNLEADANVPTYTSDDWQIGISPGDFAARPPEGYVWRPAGRQVGGLRLSARRLEDGYIIELALPWSDIDLQPTSGTAFGLAVNASDNDLPQPAQLTLVSTSPLRSWSDPRTFNRAVLLHGERPLPTR